MNRWFVIYVCALMGVVVGVSVWGCIGLTNYAVWGCEGLTKHAIVALDHFGDAGAGLTATTAKLNGKYGTIAETDKAILAAKSLEVHADMVLAHENRQLSVWDDRGTILFDNLNGGVTDLRGTIIASTKTADAITAVLQEGKKTLVTVNDPKTGVAPILADTSGAIRDLRAVTPDVHRTVTATADTMVQVKGIATDGRKVADHYEKAIDDPHKRPWYIAVLPRAIQDVVQAALERAAVK